MKENKEKFLSTQENEAMGRKYLEINPSLARAYLRAANMSDKEIEILLSQSGKSHDSEEKKMNPKEKKEMFKKMAEDFEKNAKRARENGKEEKAKEYENLAHSYRRETEKDIKE